MSQIVEILEAFFTRPWLEIGRDIFDIAAVAALIYSMLVVIKGTRAMQMGIGLALLFVIYQVSKTLHFVTLWTILDSLLTYLVLIIVVIFQNDIRRALMRVGQRPLFRAAENARDTQVFEEVIKAATALAGKRIGALVVFERDAILDEFIEPGTDLDAAVSKELLYSIFVPSFENPMHDGAVIIRDGRVWQAGAFLPLTASMKLDRTLGTRHRAAIGISEETDAVVVVVSEERGAISLCFNGNMVRNLDGASLREALIGLFYRRPKKKAKRSPSTRPSVPTTPRSTQTPLPPAPKVPAEGDTTERESRPSTPVAREETS